MIFNLLPSILSLLFLQRLAFCEANICKLPDGRILRLGESATLPRECMQVTCAEKGQLVGLSCPLPPPLTPNCVLRPGDPAKEYPGCCAEVKCEATTCTLSDGRILRIGESATLRGKCTQVTCAENGRLVALSCPLPPPIAQNCVIQPGDPAKEYPGCCPEYKCKSSCNCGSG